MASKPAEIVGQILAIPVDAIAIGDRLRPVDPVWADALGAVMTAEGQNVPIEVCRLPGQNGYHLVAGAHRLEGARLRGWATISAVVVGASAIGRRLREVSENLWRKGLGPIDRAAFVAELYDLQRAKRGVEDGASPQQIAAGARWSKAIKAEAHDASATIAHAYGFAAEVADQVGLSRRSIYNDLALHRWLRADVVEQLRGLPIASNGAQLRALAKLSEADQRRAVALIVSGDAKGVAEAIGIINQAAAKSPETKAWSAYFGGWSRMSAATRLDALREQVAQGLPKGVSVTFDDGEGA